MTAVVTLVVPFLASCSWESLPVSRRLWQKHGQQIVDWLHLRLAQPALLLHIVAAAPIAELTEWPFLLTVTFGIYCALAIGFTLSALRSNGDIQAKSLEGA